MQKICELQNLVLLDAHIFKSLASIKLFTWNTIIMMGIQDKNTKNGIKSNNYPKRETLREPEKLNIDWLVYCNCTVQWAEEQNRNVVCRINSKLASTTITLKLSLVRLASHRPSAQTLQTMLIVCLLHKPPGLEFSRILFKWTTPMAPTDSGNEKNSDERKDDKNKRS